MRLHAFAFLASLLFLLVAPQRAAARPDDRGVFSINGRIGNMKVTGDVEDAKGSVGGLFFDGISDTGYDWAWGTAFNLGTEMLFGSFDYDGTDFPFESDKRTRFDAFGFVVGMTFFKELPLQLQLDLPLMHVDLSQTDKYEQSYGSQGFMARIGRLYATGVTASLDFETHTIRQTVNEKETSITFNMALLTLGWALGK